MSTVLASIDWSRVQAFLAVAEAGSLSAAARALNLSQPTLGRHIRALEAETGLVLFTRQARGLALTEAGAALLGPARAMGEAAHGLSLAAAGRSEDPAGTVRITASRFVSCHVLPPLLARLRETDPLIQIELVPSDASQNLLFREADIAIRMYRPEQLDMVTRRIGDLALGFYAARSYLARKGRPVTFEDLMAHDLVGLDRGEEILLGMRAFGLDARRDWFALRCDDHLVNWALVRAGCGVGIVQVGVAEAAEDVERVCPDIPLPALPVWLTAHEAVRYTPRVARVWSALADGLATRIGADRKTRDWAQAPDGSGA